MWEHTQEECLVSCKHVQILIFVAAVLGVVVVVLLGKVEVSGKQREVESVGQKQERTGSGSKREGTKSMMAERLTREVGDG